MILDQEGHPLPPPHNIELEQGFIGSVLVSDLDGDGSQLVAETAGLVKPEHFWEPTHGRIWEAVLKRFTDEKQISPVTIKSDMLTDPGLMDLGYGYLASMAGVSMGFSTAKAYAEEIVELHRRRTIIEVADKAADLAMTGSADDAVTTLDNALVDLPMGEGRERSVSILNSVTNVISNVFVEERVLGLSTSIEDLDDRLGGLFAGYTILAGRPSMGKTALALAMGQKAAQRGAKVAIWSLEMTAEELTERMISADCGVPYSDIRRGKFDREVEGPKIVDAAQTLGHQPIRVIPEHVLTLEEGYASIKDATKWLGGLDLVIVDFLQLIEAPGRSPTERVGNASLGLKRMGKKLGVPMLTLSQLSRAVESREDKRPQLSDLRDSGSIEQDADTVLFTYRPEYYLEREKPDGNDLDAMADWTADLQKWKNRMQVITAKQRMGEIGTDVIGCNMGTNTFWSLRPEPEDELAF